MAEVRPIDLSLFARDSLQLQEGLVFLWTQAGHGTAQLHEQPPATSCQWKEFYFGI